MAAKSRLTGKQRAFVEHYIACKFNATEAARRAGYAGGDVTLRAMAHENITKPHIVAAIAERVAETAMGADEVLIRLAAIARADPGEFMEIAEDGSYRLDLKKAERAGMLGLIKKLTATQYGPGIELHDAHAALVDLGRHLSLFKERLELTGKDGKPIAATAAVITVSADDLAGMTPDAIADFWRALAD